MVSDMIVGGLILGLIFTILALIDFFLTKGTIFSIVSAPVKKLTGLPISPTATAVIFFVVGIVMLGGFGAWWGVTGGRLIGTATVLGADGLPAVSETTLIGCEYKNGGSSDLNITVRTDTTRSDLIWLDADESTGLVDEASDMLTHLNITCVRSDNIQEEAIILLTAKADTFISEVSTSDASTYSLVERKTQDSTVWTGNKQGEIYLASSVSTSSADIEKEWLAFDEGTKETTFTVTIELDKQSLLTQNNYTSHHLRIYQGEAQTDEVFDVIVQKIP